MSSSRSSTFFFAGALPPLPPGRDSAAVRSAGSVATAAPPPRGCRDLHAVGDDFGRVRSGPPYPAICASAGGPRRRSGGPFSGIRRRFPPAARRRRCCATRCAPAFRRSCLSRCRSSPGGCWSPRRHWSCSASPDRAEVADQDHLFTDAMPFLLSDRSLTSVRGALSQLYRAAPAAATVRHPGRLEGANEKEYISRLAWPLRLPPRYGIHPHPRRTHA